MIRVFREWRVGREYVPMNGPGLGRGGNTRGDLGGLVHAAWYTPQRWV